MTLERSRSWVDVSLVLGVLVIGACLTSGACWSIAQTISGPGDRSLPQLHVASGRVIAAAGLLLSQAVMLSMLSLMFRDTRRLHRTFAIVLLLLSMIAMVAGVGLRLAR